MWEAHLGLARRLNLPLALRAVLRHCGPQLLHSGRSKTEGQTSPITPEALQSELDPLKGRAAGTMILLSWAITLNKGRPCEQAVGLHATVSHLPPSP